MNAYFNFGTLEAMRTRIVRVEDKMYGNEVQIVQRVLVQRAGLVETMLQSVDVGRDEGLSRESTLVKALLMDLQSLLRDVDVLDWGAGRALSFRHLS